MTEPTTATPTILKAHHESLGARMAPFGGFLMPIQYAGIMVEHTAVRQHAGLFDTCHMGEFRVEGGTAAADLDRLVSCDVSTLDPGRCRYGLLCRDDGGVLDDLIVYRLEAAVFMVVVNAGTQAGDFDWMRERVSGTTRLTDISSETGKLDLQGPAAPAMLDALLDASIRGTRYFGFAQNHLDGRPVLVSRTGYTGEIGFELYSDPDTTLRLWSACLEAGASPAGLGARDTLRLEVGLPLYGHEMSIDRNAAQCGFTRALSEDKDFIGSSAIRAGTGLGQSLIGCTLEGRRAAREGDRIALEDGTDIGIVTSGSFAPSLGNAIALGYVDIEHCVPGRSVQVCTSRQALSGKLESPPFYREGTARKPLRAFLEKAE